MNKKHFIGEKIQNLIIIEELKERDKFGNKKWLCQCKCGNKKIYTTSSLRVVKSCGCSKRTNVFYTINGITKTQSQWCRYYNIPRTNVRRRLSSGWNIEKALTTPIRKWK